MWIHMDHHISFVSHNSIALLNLAEHPVPKLIAHHSTTNIDYPLFWNLWHIFIIWRIMLYIASISDEVNDLLDAQILVLGHLGLSDLGIRDVLFLHCYDLLQKVDRNIF